MKKALLAGLLTAGLAVSTSAYDTKVVTGFNGNDGANINTYHNVGLGSSQLILGVNASTLSFDGDAKPAAVFSGTVGLTFATDIPVLDNFELKTSIAQTKAAADSDGKGGGEGIFQIGQTWTLSKKYYAKLTDKIEVGINADLLQVSFGQENIQILPQVNPVFAMTVKI